MNQRDSFQNHVFDLLPAQQRRLREQVNATETDIPQQMLGDAFVEQARKHPESIAICTLDRQVSNGELLKSAAEVTQWRHVQRVERNELVDLITMRGPEQRKQLVRPRHSAITATHTFLRVESR